MKDIRKVENVLEESRSVKKRLKYFKKKLKKNLRKHFNSIKKHEDAKKFQRYKNIYNKE